MTIGLATWTLLPLITSCNSSNRAGTETTAVTSEIETTTTDGRPLPLDDQTPPKTARGLSFSSNRLWLADEQGADGEGHVLALDPDTMKIFVRWKASDGIPWGVRDLAVGSDGSLYWTGYSDGSVGRMSPGNVSLVVAGLKQGLSAIAFARGTPESESGSGQSTADRLYVTRSSDKRDEKFDGLWEIDPKNEQPPRLVTDSIGNISSFDIGPDGFLYGVRTDWVQKKTDAGDIYIQEGRLVKVSPKDGRVEDVPINGAPDAAIFRRPTATRVSPDGKKVFVLCGIETEHSRGAIPPQVWMVNLETNEKTVYGTATTNRVHGLAVAPDGRVFVSDADDPSITVIGAEGTATRMPIGDAK